jgi:hypothetical protein
MMSIPRENARAGIQLPTASPTPESKKEVKLGKAADS